MTTNNLELELLSFQKWCNYYSQFTINKLLDKAKLFVMFELAQLVKFDLALILGKLN